MFARRTLAASFLIVLSASFAAADLKVVKQTHRDSFTMMGQTQPAEDTEQITWIGTDRMNMNQGGTSSIVRLDTKKLYVINHTAKTFNVLDLPIDLAALVPEQMRPMLGMMQFEVTVTPGDEHKKVGEWNARRYDMTMTSQMFTMKATMWVAKVPGYDSETFKEMAVHLNSLQPGMADAVREMSKVDGLVVEQQGVMTMSMMGNTTVSTSERTSSIEELDAPAGTYDPPPDYTEETFSFEKMLQR
jgi:hypothetical protein